jgi:hypothetical protein
MLGRELQGLGVSKSEPWKSGFTNFRAGTVAQIRHEARKQTLAAKDTEHKHTVAAIRSLRSRYPKSDEIKGRDSQKTGQKRRRREHRSARATKLKPLDGEAAQVKIFGEYCTPAPRSRLYSVELNEGITNIDQRISVHRLREEKLANKKEKKKAKKHRKYKRHIDAAKIQRMVRDHLIRKAVKDRYTERVLALSAKVGLIQNRWRVLAAQKAVKKRRHFILNVHLVIAIQRLAKKKKLARTKSWTKARRRSADFRWNLVEARFRQTVSVSPLSVHTEHATSFRDDREPDSPDVRVAAAHHTTVFLNNSIEFENVAGCELTYAGNYKIVRSMAHVKIFVAEPHSPAHSGSDRVRMYDGTKVSQRRYTLTHSYIYTF